MNYTKGKWTYTEDGVIVAEDGKQIASVFPRDKEANSYLVAAAPELYEACSSFICNIGFVKVAIESKDLLAVLRDSIAKAVAKAEGKDE